MSNDGNLSRRRMILLSAASSIAIGIVAASYNTSSEEVKKPTISRSDVQRIVGSIAQSIYYVAPKYDVKLPEDYLKVVPEEILPSAISIIERRFTVIDK